jgi:hypothetical protein
MVISSVLWMEGVGLGLARNIVQRYALETGSEQGFGIDEKVAHHCFSDRKFLFSLPIQEGTSTRHAVLILWPGRSFRQEIPRRAARRRIRQPFAVSIRKMGWESTRNPIAPRTSRRKKRSGPIPVALLRSVVRERVGGEVVEKRR